MDLAIVVISYLGALWVRFDFQYSQISHIPQYISHIPFIVVIYFIVFKLLKCDKTLWNHVSVEEALRIVLASTIAATLVWLVFVFSPDKTLPNSVHLIALIFIVLILELVRFYYRIYRLLMALNKNGKAQYKKTIIVGAGDAGVMLLKEMVNNPRYLNQLVGLVDDDPRKKGRFISGFPILGTTEQLEEIVSTHNVEIIFLAMPSIPVIRQNEIAKQCYATGAKVLFLSDTKNMISSEGIRRNLRQMNIEDLLGRKEIKLDNQQLQTIIDNKNILVTGAAGSIGSELVRQIIKLNPKTIVLLDTNENGLYALEQELFLMRKESKFSDYVEFIPLITSIRDFDALEPIFKQYQFDIVFHAAAHKHVPLMERMPEQAIKNNILGSYNVIKLADQYQVSDFINISTDKAVNPTNVMGATKRFVEKMIQCIGQDSKTIFVAVRFGNVLGSSGSVIPLFQKQIEAGGPVTVTDPEMKRYFMTIPEAVSLILQVTTFGKRGEIYVLDMGEPIKIIDLAKNMIQLAGFKPYEDIDIVFTGLRPGEKLFEEILMDDEQLAKTPHELIFVAKPQMIPIKQIQDELKLLKSVLDTEATAEEIKKVLQKVVDTYEC